jgi:hypothetical protein
VTLSSLKIKLLSSSPYYAQTNGQAESSNKTLIKVIKKIEENPKRWHEVLSEALWAHRVSKHSATKVTPFVETCDSLIASENDEFK